MTIPASTGASTSTKTDMRWRWDAPCSEHGKFLGLPGKQHGRTNRFGGWRGKEKGKVGPSIPCRHKSQPVAAPAAKKWALGRLPAVPLLFPQRGCPHRHGGFAGLPVTPWLQEQDEGRAELPAQPPSASVHISQENRYPSAMSQWKTKNSKQF